MELLLHNDLMQPIAEADMLARLESLTRSEHGAQDDLRCL